MRCFFKVEESKEKCCQYCGYLVCIALFFLLFTEKPFLDGFSSQPPSQVEVICETREEWWTALLTWLRSLGGSKGICDILQRLLDFTNSLIHLVNCSLSSNPDPECPGTFLANQLAWLKEQDVTNTDQLNSASKAMLVVVVISVHLALSALVLTVLLITVTSAYQVLLVVTGLLAHSPKELLHLLLPLRFNNLPYEIAPQLRNIVVGKTYHRRVTEVEVQGFVAVFPPPLEEIRKS